MKILRGIGEKFRSNHHYKEQKTSVLNTNIVGVRFFILKQLSQVNGPHCGIDVESVHYVDVGKMNIKFSPVRIFRGYYFVEAWKIIANLACNTEGFDAFDDLLIGGWLD